MYVSDGNTAMRFSQLKRSNPLAQKEQAHKGRHTLLSLILVLGTMSFPAKFEMYSVLEKPILHQAINGKLEDVLVKVAKVYHIPMVIELAGPLRQIQVSGGTASARQLLNQLAKQDPDYAWELHGRVVHFYHKSLKVAPLNFLNWKIDKIMISESVADVEFRLRAHLGKIRAGVKGEGGLGVGLLSSDLSKQRIQGKKILHNVTAREVLVELAETDGHFYSVVVFQTPTPSTDADVDAAFLSWRLIPLSTEEPIRKGGT